jgi:hypothetical protein
MKTTRQAMMNGVLSRPLWPVTNSPPRTASDNAAPGTMISVSRRRPTLSTMASPTIIITR